MSGAQSNAMSHGRRSETCPGGGPRSDAPPRFDIHRPGHTPDPNPGYKAKRGGPDPTPPPRLDIKGLTTRRVQARGVRPTSPGQPRSDAPVPTRYLGPGRTPGVGKEGLTTHRASSPGCWGLGCVWGAWPFGLFVRNGIGYNRREVITAHGSHGVLSGGKPDEHAE